ncbi:class I SAM-dependent methyltransferase [Opitutales bacterium]|nr:class I SAM-dependent methyltransferase [Opitutales bacterium]
MSLKSRFEIPKLLPKNSIGIELGVATGYYSEILLKSQKFLKLFSIDRWSDHHGIDEYLCAARLLSKYDSNSILIRSTFKDIIHLFPEQYFDFIYIDAYAHTGQENGQILEDWFPKLKNGGIFSGHDYEKEFWPQTFNAVTQFCQNNHLGINIAHGINGGVNNEDQWMSWYSFK